MDRAVLARWFLVRFVPEVVGNNQCRYAAFRFCHAHRTVDQVTDLRSRAGLLHEGARHVLEHADQIDFLLIVSAERRPGLLPGNRQDRDVIHPRVIHAGDQMGRAGARRRDANAEFAGELGIGRGHERGHFLVARLNELDLVSPEAGQAAQQSVDAVAGIAKDAPDAPLMQAFPKEITDCLCHLDPPYPTMTPGTRQALRQLPDVSKFIKAAPRSAAPCHDASPPARRRA